MAHTPVGSPSLTERERREAQTIAEHLPPGYTADFVLPPAEDDGSAARPSMPTPPLRPDSTVSHQSGSHEVSSLTLQGGDVHRSLFRMAETPPPKHHRRAATFHETMGSDAGSIMGGEAAETAAHATGYGSIGAGGGIDRIASPMPVRDMMAPQGFRRAFLQQRQQEREQQARQRRRELLHERRVSTFGAARLPITRNFVEFLELYGHFADEDLETSDDEGEEEEEERRQEEEEEEPIDEDMEQQALLGADAARSEAGKAKSGMAQSFFTLLKAFVGTGIMFLPKAYNNGGMAFSTATLLVVAALSMSGFQLLLQCRQRFGGSYGDIGAAIAGPHMRGIVLGSIALSQLGFVCAGIVFVAENLASFAAAVAANRVARGLDGGAPVSTSVLIGLEAAALVPLAFVRDIARLGPAALLGDVFIGLGLAYMYAYDLTALAARGWRVHETVEPWFNAGGYALTVGAAIFTFEGIGLILPIQSSMARPERFGRLLAVVMALITAAYVSVGALGYATFGTHTRTEVIDNYPRSSPLVQTVQFLYALAVLAGLPVQLFPAVRILEGRLFGHRHSGKRSPRVKWIKNALRTALIVLCAAVAILGAGQLDQFVALIGSLACVPLLFIYPPYLHYRAIAVTPAARTADVTLMVVGAVAMVYTTAVTVSGL